MKKICFQCAEELHPDNYLTMQFPMVTEHGRDIIDIDVCIDCIPLVQDRTETAFKINNLLMDFMQDVDFEQNLKTMDACEVKRLNILSDEVYPLIPGRVPSFVLDSFEAMLRS